VTKRNENETETKRKRNENETKTTFPAVIGRGKKQLSCRPITAGYIVFVSFSFRFRFVFVSFSFRFVTDFPSLRHIIPRPNLRAGPKKESHSVFRHCDITICRGSNTKMSGWGIRSYAGKITIATAKQSET